MSSVAGVIVDRFDRRRILVAMDLIRGACIIFLSIAAFNGFIEIWMVFFVGVILGICIAFYSPCVNSSVPDIVPASKLIAANSAIGIVYSATNIVGSSVGGIIFKLFGAPVIFLFNGVSYIVSGIFNLFVKIPKVKKTHEQQHFLQDLRDGYHFIWRFRGLRYLLIGVAVLNFFSFIAIVLMIPLFQQSPELGSIKYGIAMATLTTGMLLGMVLISFIKIPPSRKITIFFISSIILPVCFATFALTYQYMFMLVLALIGGFFLAIVNVMINTTIQMTVPADKRGKVFSLVQMVTTGLTPISMALGGILGEFFPIRSIIFICFIFILFTFFPISLSKNFKRFISFDAEKETLEDII